MCAAASRAALRGAALLLAASVALARESEVEALRATWTGHRDSTEQVLAGADSRPVALAGEVGVRRVRTEVSPVELPWLGAHLLFLEEFLADAPEDPRRAVLMSLEPERGGVRVQLHALQSARRWRHLAQRPALLARLRPEYLADTPGCSLHLVRDGAQFRGGVRGRACPAGKAGYLRYELVVGPAAYWYRRRILAVGAPLSASARADRVLEDVMGYDRFEPGERRLFVCRLGPEGRSRPEERAGIELNDHGGTVRIQDGSGRPLELSLRNQDWPYAAENDALLLLLRVPGAMTPVAVSWAQADSTSISLDYGTLAIRCGALQGSPDDELDG